MSLVFKALDENDVKDILSRVESYSNNSRLVLNQFYKYFDEDHIKQEKLWYGCFEDDRCVALSVLKKIPKGFILLAEIQSIIKGYGKLLIKNILNRSKNIWWCTDPTGGDDLVNYYRQFNVEEHLIKMSKWTYSPEYAFFKVSDDKHRAQILDTFDKADMSSEKYNPNKL